MRGDGAIAGGGGELRRLSRKRKAGEHGLLLIYQSGLQNENEFSQADWNKTGNIKCGDQRV